MKIGIDLGTANVIVYVKGKGIVITEPSVVAVGEDNRIVAVGEEAREMIGRTPGNIQAIRPMKDGVIADYVITEAMLRFFINKATKGRIGFNRPEVMISVPAGVTSVEKRAVRDAALKAGAKEAYLIEEPLAAAIGAGVPIAEPVGRMIVDIGGGTSEVAIISLGGIVVSRSVRVGGYDLDDAIGSYIRNVHRMAIGSQSAEQIKKEVGSAAALTPELSTRVRGRDLLSGLPRELDLGSAEVRTALEGPLSEIMAAVRETLEETPPELAGDLARHGILLAGGGSLMHGFAERVEAETGMPAYLAESPLTCVAVGAGHALEELDVLTRGLYSR
jgi:rod shape-determining protein MreB and related proteins